MSGSFFVRRDNNSLVPTSRAGQLSIEALKFGQRYQISPKQPRNERAHRLFWALMGYAADALSKGPAGAVWTADSLKDDLLVATGRSRHRPMTRLERARFGLEEGQVGIVARPVSISLSAMTGDEFSEFMSEAFEYIRNHLAPWIEGSEHWLEIEKILAQSLLMRGKEDEKGEKP